jgi:hypothetical protein
MMFHFKGVIVEQYKGNNKLRSGGLLAICIGGYLAAAGFAS